jgi:hypothetical protein
MDRFDRSMFVGALMIWMACGAVMGIGQATATKDNALLIHLLAAPVIVAIVSWIYFTRSGSGRVAFTAAVFTAIPFALDLFLVALVLLRSLDMFTSPIGTWIPFALIFAVTYVTGRVVSARRGSPVGAPAV